MYGCTHRLMERLYTTGGGNERGATARAQPTPFRLPTVTIGPSAVDVVVRYWHRVGGESLAARRRGSGVRLPLGLVVARQSQALCRTCN